MNIIIDDDYSLCKEGFLVAKGVEIPLTSDFKTKTVDIPKRKGAWDFGTELGTTPFKIPLICTVQDVHERRYKMDEIIDILTDDFGEPKRVKFQFSAVKEYHIYLKLVKIVTPKRFNTSADIILELTDLDSVWLSDSRANDVVWGSRKITFESDYFLGNKGTLTEFEITGSGYHEIENIARPVKPIIKISGTGTNVKINNKNQSVSIGNISNDTFEIDFNKYVAYKNGREYNMYVDDFYLFKGINKLQITGTNLKFKVTVKFNYER